MAVVAVVCLLPAVLTIVGASDAADRLGGDFPSFYGAGTIVLDGQADRLYEPEIQRAAQVGFHEHPDEYLFFAYPPYVAAAYAGISWLPYGVALTVQALLALVALVAAFWFLFASFPSDVRTGDLAIAATAAGLVTYPIVTSVLGGQNTTFTLALMGAVWYGVAKSQVVLPAAALTLLMFKPQFGLLVVVAVVAARRWRVVLGAGAGAIGLYLGTAAWLGAGWVGTWIDQVTRFGEANDVVNGDLMVNIVGWVANLSTGLTADVVGWTAVVAVTVVTLVGIVRHGFGTEVFGMAGGWVVLASLSTLFYDAGIAIAGFGLWVLMTDRRPWWIVAAIGVTWTQLGARALGWSPLFIVVVALWAIQSQWAMQSAGRPSVGAINGS